MCVRVSIAIVLIDCVRSDSVVPHLHNASQQLSSLPCSQATTVHTAAHLNASHAHIKKEYRRHLELQPIYYRLCLAYAVPNHSEMLAMCN